MSHAYIHMNSKKQLPYHRF